MLREYRLTNFKAFGKTVTIPIRPLTLIFGANSSGKSSIFQSLLLLKQTLEESKNPETTLLPKGNLVDLGTYSDFVHRHETERNFEFGARFSLEDSDAGSPLLRKIFEKAKATDAVISVQFLCNEEDRKATPNRVAIAVSDETSPIISYGPSELSGRYANPSINTESEFWRCWWEETKRHVADQIRNAFVVSSLGKRYIAEEYPVETDELALRDFERILENYQVGDAIKHLSEVSIHYISSYRNFLPNARHMEGWKANAEILDQLISSPGEHDEVSRLVAQIADTMRKNAEAMENIREKSPFEAEISILANYASDFNDTGGAYEEDRNIQGLDVSPITRLSCSAFERALRDIVHIGPIRSQPKRYDAFNGDSIEYVGQTGENLPFLLINRPMLLSQINKELQLLGVKYCLKEPSELQYEDRSPSNVFSLRLIDQDTGVEANIRDVGFGISQVLPVVLQSRLSEKKTLLIEQPEIHLHPAHQAELGDLFIRSAKEQGNTFLLETHSEHLLLRIMRRMRETSMGIHPEGALAVRPEDVMVLFVEQDGSQSIVREMPLNERGELVKAWPGGFFEEGLREIF